MNVGRHDHPVAPTNDIVICVVDPQESSHLNFRVLFWFKIL